MVAVEAAVPPPEGDEKAAAPSLRNGKKASEGEEEGKKNPAGAAAPAVGSGEGPPGDENGQAKNADAGSKDPSPHATKDPELLALARAREDACLQKAAIARAAHAASAKIAQLPKIEQPPKNTTHWDYVMQEMQWLAYDVGQERRWKRSTARQFATACAKKASAAATTTASSGATKSTKKKKQETKAEKAAAAVAAAAAAEKEAEEPSLSSLSSQFCYEVPEQALFDFYASIEEEEERRMKEFMALQQEYETKQETHRKLAAAAHKQQIKHRERVKMQRIKEELLRTKRALAASQRDLYSEDFLDLDNLDMDGLVSGSGKGKKKRKASKMLDKNGLGGQQMLMYDAEGNLVPVVGGKKKKLKKQRGLLDPESMGLLGADLGVDVGGKKKKGLGAKKKKKMMQMGMIMGDVAHYPPGMGPAQGVGGKKKKSGRKDSKKKGAKAAGGAFRGRDSRTFGDAKIELVQLLNRPATNKLASTSAKGSKSDSKLKQDLAALLKVQAKDSKKKSQSQSKKKSKASASAAEGGLGANQRFIESPPWSTAEDQVLMAVVYEFGSNWGLVSDVLSCTYQLRDGFRRPHACRQRFKWIVSTNVKSSSKGGGAGASKQAQQQAAAAAATAAAAAEKQAKIEPESDAAKAAKEEAAKAPAPGEAKPPQPQPAPAGAAPPQDAKPPASSGAVAEAPVGAPGALAAAAPKPVANKEPYVSLLKVNRGNAKLLLEHVRPADEETIKRHLDVVLGVASKHRMARQSIESASKDSHLVEPHQSHKNAQAMASRGHMLMNPGALCEFVHASSRQDAGPPAMPTSPAMRPPPMMAYQPHMQQRSHMQPHMQPRPGPYLG